MKRPRSFSSNSRTRKVACTVSAAALMLGVSHAATVGFNFQCNYCAATSYSGAVVTGPAFGIGTNGWESLSQMDTGYGCSAGYFTLNQVINNSSSGGGLNPLPNGSLNLSWSAYTANVSGFAGYSRSGPHYTFGGNGYKPGNEQVYWGFLRDGVNFGPGSAGGDNNQPGYSIDITGLKTLFTNTPFAVQLIASADSMQYLTNAFVIDATGNTTQSVVYPSTPPVADVVPPDTAWIRGIGGGLSTGSGSFNTDHLKIIGNRAAHGGNKVTGTNFASTISGFIITDKPVISMSPQQVLVCGGDTVLWSGYAVGVPPLAYQWRKNGMPIAGATTSTYGVTNATVSGVGTYDLLVTNLYGTALSSPVTVGDGILTSPITNLVLDSNPKGPEHDGLNHGAIWLASSTDGASVTRTGVMSFSASGPSQIAVAGETNFDSSIGTIMFWMRSSGVANPSGTPAALFDRLSGSGTPSSPVPTGNGGVIVQNTDGTVSFQAYVGGGQVSGGIATTASVSDNRWHQVAVVYDQSTSGPLGNSLPIYVDGVVNNTGGLGVNWSWQPGQELEWGLSHDTNSWQAYNGLMDDVRFYNRALTAPEIASAYSGALVDTNALVMQLNFATAPGRGIMLTWRCPDAVLQSANSINGPYTDLPGAVSPYNVGVQKTAQFYRYRGHIPVVIISNPYLM
jgi:hypothetical protein